MQIRSVCNDLLLNRTTPNRVHIQQSWLLLFCIALRILWCILINHLSYSITKHSRPTYQQILIPLLSFWCLAATAFYFDFRYKFSLEDIICVVVWPGFVPNATILCSMSFVQYMHYARIRKHRSIYRHIFYWKDNSNFNLLQPIQWIIYWNFRESHKLI